MSRARCVDSLPVNMLCQAACTQLVMRLAQRLALYAAMTRNAKQVSWCLQEADGVEAVLSELAAILADSDGGMAANAPLVTPAQKSAWWSQRAVLDGRLAALLAHLDAAWLGPWR